MIVDGVMVAKITIIIDVLSEKCRGAWVCDGEIDDAVYDDAISCSCVCRCEAADVSQVMSVKHVEDLCSARVVFVASPGGVMSIEVSHYNEWRGELRK